MRDPKGADTIAQKNRHARQNKVAGRETRVRLDPTSWLNDQSQPVGWLPDPNSPHVLRQRALMSLLASIGKGR